MTNTTRPILRVIAFDHAVRRAYEIAKEAHGNQKRKYTGFPYITHLLNVAEMVHERKQDRAVVCAALLHDVVEDTDYTLLDIASLMEDHMPTSQELVRVLKIVKGLTDVFTSEAYPKNNRALRKRMEADRLSAESADVHTVKYADLIDNCQDIVINDAKFAELYLDEMHQILVKCTTGEPRLYQRAFTEIDRAEQKLKR